LSRLRDSRLNIFTFKHSGHVSKLRNIGLQKAAGKYIAFLDSDDEWHKDHLINQVKYLDEDNSLGFVFSDVVVYDNEVLVHKGVYGSDDLSLVRGNFFSKVISGQLILLPSTLLFRRECLEKCGFLNENFLTGEFEFIARMAYSFNGARCFYPPVKINRHADNYSKICEVQSFREVLQTMNQFYTKRMISKILYKERSLEFHYKLGFKFWECKKYFNAVREFLTCYRLKPVNWKIIIKNIKQLLY
jgi:glycosyltransferase involved in cell wall biosynthesis